MNRLFSPSSSPLDHTSRRRNIPLVDVFATRGKHVGLLTVDINLVVLMLSRSAVLIATLWKGIRNCSNNVLLVSKPTPVPQAATHHQRGHPMWLTEPPQQLCRPEMPTLLLQLPTLPRWTLNIIRTLPALHFSQDVSPVYHALDKHILLPRAPAKWPLCSKPFRWN
jgi:hypothetical protein